MKSSIKMKKLDYYICFLILHFGDPKITFKAINSLLKLDNINNTRIIVLDNGSNNGSYEALRDKYSNNTIIDFYKSENNLGFSSGNNFMYNKALKYNPRFVIAMNNDIEIRDKKFINKLLSIDSTNIYIIGPDIYTPLFFVHQNPDGISYYTDKKVKEILKNIKKIDNSFFKHLKQDLPLFGIRQKIGVLLCNKYVKYLVSRIFKNFDEDSFGLHRIKRYNPLFCGAFLIFTKNYIKNEKKLFEPETFFYGEELLLALKCHTLNYKTLYTPEIKVIHHSKASTKKKMTNNEIVKKQIKVCKYYLEVYKNNIWKKRVLKNS